MFDNIDSVYQGNFEVQDNSSATTSDTLYDYNSIMHYGRDYFTK